VCAEALTLALPGRGYTLLMIAASSDRVDLVTRLLAPHAPQDRARVILGRQDCSGSCALSHAAKLKRLNVLQAFLRAVLVSVEAGGWELHPVEGGTDLVRLSDLCLTMEEASSFPEPTKHFLRDFLANPWQFFGIARGGSAASERVFAEAEAEAQGEVEENSVPSPSSSSSSSSSAAAAAAAAAPAAIASGKGKVGKGPAVKKPLGMPAVKGGAEQTSLEDGSVEGWDVFAANEKLFGVKVGELSAEDSASYGLREIRLGDFTAAQVAAADAIAKEIGTAKGRGQEGGNE